MTLERRAPGWVSTLLALFFGGWPMAIPVTQYLVDRLDVAPALVRAGVAPGRFAVHFTTLVGALLLGAAGSWSLAAWARRRWGRCTLAEGRLAFELPFVVRGGRWVVSLEDVTGWEETAAGIRVHAAREAQEPDGPPRRRGPLSAFLFPLLVPTRDAAERDAVARFLVGR